MAPFNVIVFGATGNVGSVAARAAQQLGAKVFLAVRDLEKPVPGLSPEDERAGGFERVRADLSDPESVRAAATRTGAQRAFVYIAQGTTDYMQASFTALRAGGVERVVFLSSALIGTAGPAAVPPTDAIGYAHARVELALAEAFGPRGFVAVRPAYFATNALRWAPAVRAGGDVLVAFPKARFDYITPGDMGRVSGALLADSRHDNESAVYLRGPELLSQWDAVAAIGKVVGRELKVVEIGADEAVEQFKSRGTPEPIALQVVGALRARSEADDVGDDGFYVGPLADAFENVKKFTGRNPTTFPEWAEAEWPRD